MPGLRAVSALPISSAGRVTWSQDPAEPLPASSQQSSVSCSHAQAPYPTTTTTPRIRLPKSLSYRVGVGVRTQQALGVLHPALPPAGSVEVAIAVFLGTCIVVVVAILGYCFFKNQKKDIHRHRHPPPSTPTSSKVSTTDDMEHLVYYQTTRPL